MSTPFAVFAVARVGDRYAATTRAADRGEAGRIGLPGGKVDPGEDPVKALFRESAEEGWQLGWVGDLIYSQLVDGRLVHWYRAGSATALAEYKEKGRIAPILATAYDVVNSGYGNENLSLQ